MNKIAEKVQAVYNLTPMQQGMLWKKALDENSPVNFIQYCIETHGSVDEGMLRSALELVYERHDVFRTMIMYHRVEVPRQIVLKSREPGFEAIDMSQLAEAGREQALRDVLRRDEERGFNLESDPLFRMILLHAGGGKSYVILTFQHIIVDGWSLGIAVNDLNAAYKSLLSGRTHAELSAQIRQDRRKSASYGDYVRHIESLDAGLGLAYWKKLLETCGEPIPFLPPTEVADRSGTADAAVPLELDHRLKTLASKLGITINTILETAYGIALQHCAGAGDVVFGKVVSGRDVDMAGLDGVVGLFVNTVPVRITAEAGETVASLLAKIHEQSLGGARFGYSALPDVLRQNAHGSGLIRALYVHENHASIDDENLSFLGHPAMLKSGGENTGYALVLKIAHKNTMHMEIVYSEDYSASAMQLLAERIVGLLDQMSFDPSAAISSLNVFSDGERQRILATSRSAAAQPAVNSERQPTEDMGKYIKMVAQSFERVLNLNRPVGIHEKFTDLGGHSLRALRSANILESLSGVRVPLRHWYTTPTVEGIAAALRDEVAKQQSNAGKTAATDATATTATTSVTAATDTMATTATMVATTKTASTVASAAKAASTIETVFIAANLLPVAPIKPYYPMSSVQRRIYAISQLDGASGAYNTPYAVEFSGTVDQGRLSTALYELSKRHDALRTAFLTAPGELGDEPVQAIAAAGCVYVKPEFIDAGDLIDDEGYIKTLLHDFIRPFDLAAAPLMRVATATGKGRTVLMLDIHHIIFDGATFSLLIDELAELYNGRSLPEPERQYKDWSEWSHGRDLSSQKAWWAGEFAREAPVLDMPIDFARPNRQSFSGGIVSCPVPDALWESVDAFARGRGATPYMVMLAALSALLGRYGGEEDVVVGSPVSGRTHPQSERIAGMFVNTVALRSRPERGKPFDSLLGEIKRTCVQAYENQDYPFEQLLMDIPWIRRDFSRNPLFDVVFSMQNTEPPRADFNGLKFMRELDVESPARFDITINVSDMHKPRRIDLSYNKELYREDSAGRMLRHFLLMLEAAVGDPGCAIGDLPLMDEVEKDLVLRVFNGDGANERQFVEIDSTATGDDIHIAATDSGTYINAYGINEAAFGTVTLRHVRGENITEKAPIGKPLPGVTAYVLDGLSPCPIGVPGELCIGGAAVGRGYKNKPDLMAEKFFNNPFDNGLLYRTGDIARWLPDGNLEFLGKLNEQIKINGYRVKLGEIEAALKMLPGVRNAAVTANEDSDGDNQLMGYAEAGGEVTPAMLRTALLGMLPEYMIPNRIAVLDSLPLSDNGTVDKKALPDIDVHLGTEDADEPQGPLERLAADLFAEILGPGDLSHHDFNRRDFSRFDIEFGGGGHGGRRNAIMRNTIMRNGDFFRLGGDSIKAIRLVSRFRSAGYEITVRDIMTRRTVEGIAAALRANAGTGAAPNEAAGLGGAATPNGAVTSYGSVVPSGAAADAEIPLTPIQRSFFEHKYAHPEHFNQSLFLRVSYRLDEEALRVALSALVQNHDIIRAVYEGGMQKIPPCGGGEPFELTYHYMQNSKLPRDEIEAANNALQSGMDLSNGPLLKAAVYRTDAADHLMLCMHHLIVDGVSWRIIAEDIYSAYSRAAAGLKPLAAAKTASYREWSEMLAEYAEVGIQENEREYWANILSESVKWDVGAAGAKNANSGNGCNNGNDHGHGLQVAPRYASKAIRAGRETTRSLLFEACGAYETEINDILLCALAYAVREWTGAEKTAVELESHGRAPLHRPIETDRTVGWFTSCYPVILECRGDIESSILATKAALRGAPKHGIGFGLLATRGAFGGVWRHMGLIFNYLGETDSEMAQYNGVFGLSEYPSGRMVAVENRFPNSISINGGITGGELSLEVMYDELEWDAKNIGTFCSAYEAALKKIVAHCGAASRAKTQAAVQTNGSFGDAEVPKTAHVNGSFGDAEVPLEEFDEIMQLY